MDPVRRAALAEHGALADTLERVGPGAPTLLEGWTTTELAAHMACLEAARGFVLFVGRQAITRTYPRPTATSRRMAQRALERAQARGYDWCVDRVRHPHQLPMRMGGAPVAVFEVVVHHQDVVRADPGLEPRPAPPELATCLPWLVRFHTKQVRDVELVATTPDGEHGAGIGDRVEVRGDTLEVVLWLAGREAHAEVEVDGDPAAVERVHPVTRI